MFIINLKINGSKFFKIFFCIILIVLFIIIGFITFKIINQSKNGKTSCIPQNDVFDIPTNNYTNVLKTVHDNTDKFVNCKIKVKGFVYRLYDFSDNQFVLARNMIISSDQKKVVVGFLCEYDDIKKFDNNTWVEITGIITKGNYHGDIPIIKIDKIEQIEKPNDEYVYPPDENYIPTSGLL